MKARIKNSGEIVDVYYDYFLELDVQTESSLQMLWNFWRRKTSTGKKGGTR